MTSLCLDCGGRGQVENFTIDIVDQYIVGEQTFTHDHIEDIKEIQDEIQSRICRTYRWSILPFRYEIPIQQKGKYQVELWFAEIRKGAFQEGQRVFSVQVLGDDPTSSIHEIKNLDIFSQVGANTCLSKKFIIYANKLIQIKFYSGHANHPMISAILIHPETTPTTTTTTTITTNIPPTLSKPTTPQIFPNKKYPTASNLTHTKAKIDAYGRKIRHSGTKLFGYNIPYYMFHLSSFQPYGTILLFHGLGGAVYDQRILAKYLYDSGFNVVNGILPMHSYSGKYWPQIHIANKYGGKDLEKKLKQDVVLQGILAGSMHSSSGNVESSRRDENQRRRLGNMLLGMEELMDTGRGELTSRDIPKILERVREIEPRMKYVSTEDYMRAISDDTDERFNDIFDSNHMDYLYVAQEQLDLLNEIPGDIFTCGSNVGGAVAMAIAAANPGRVKKCFSATPMLELYEREPNTARTLVNALGPLGVRDFGWNSRNRFPMTNLTAAGRFGGFTTSNKEGKQTFKTGQCQLFLCLTEMENAADIKTNRKFFRDIGGVDEGHILYIYEKAKKVPHHSLTDPTKISQGTSNRYYKSLYREIFRFFTTGQVKKANLDKFDFDEEDIPKAPQAKVGWNNYREL